MSQTDNKNKAYECPECGTEEPPKIISRFPPQIYQCTECGKKGNESDFFKKKESTPQFTPLPKHPP